MKRIEDNAKLRKTSLTDAVVELFTCVEALAFKGSYASSFSDTIHHLRQVHGTRSPADEHSIAMPKADDNADGVGGAMAIELLSRGMFEMAQAAAADAGW